MDAIPSDAVPQAPVESRADGPRRYARFETVLWIAGFIYQALFRVVRYELGFDQLVQFTATQGAMAGRGLGALTAVPTDLSTVRSVKVFYWPPGWSFLQVPFVGIFRNDYWATYLSDMAGLALLLVSIRYLLNRFGDTIGPMVRLLLIFSLGFVTTPNGNWWYANVWALAFFMAATALVMPRGLREAPDKAYFLSGWLLGGCVWMRYQYLSTVGTILIVIVLMRGFRPGLTKIGFHLAGLAISLIPLGIWRFFPRVPTATGLPADSRVVATAHGIFLKGLVYTAPPAAVALSGDAWRSSMLGYVMPAYLARLEGPLILGCLGWALTMVAVIGAVSAIQNPSNDPLVKNDVRRFYAIGLCGYLLNLSLLVYMSVIRDYNVIRWVYVQIGRYHMIATVFMLVGLAQFITLVRGPVAAVLKGILAAGGAVLLLMSATQGSMTMRRLARGDWGPPLSRHFWNRGAAVDLLVSRTDESRQNVLVHIGPVDNSVTALMSMARYCGYAAAATTRPEQIDTVSPVHLVLTTPVTGLPSSYRDKFDELCSELGPQTTVGPMLLCDGRFLPRRRHF